jgi:hypothetical protein
MDRMRAHLQEGGTVFQQVWIRICSGTTKLAMVLLLCLCCYVVSVIWRVSQAEQEEFGRSTLIKVCGSQCTFCDPPTQESWYEKSYIFVHNGKRIRVWRDKINAFQHIYGSAIVAYEVGDFLADLVFCGNEWAEFVCDWNGVTWQDILDRRKDLAHNRLGRHIGVEARRLGITGKTIERYLINKVLESMNNDRDCYLSFLDPRLSTLRNDRFLPRYNEFNYALRALGIPDPDPSIDYRLCGGRNENGDTNEK